MDFKEEITKALKREINQEVNLEIPQNHTLGDYAFPCFSLSKIYKKDPKQIALDLSKKIKSKYFRIEANGPYLNFFIDRKVFSENSIKEILKPNFGKFNKTNKKILVEFCHANTHKAFHIGHTRNICLGESLSRILEFTGNKVIRANYQGDIGMHVAKTIYGLLNLNKLNLKEPKTDKGKWLCIVYAAASNLFSKDENIAKEINEINQKLYSGDKKLIIIWKESRKWSIDYFEKNVYPVFNVKFDRFYFESEVEKKGVERVKKLLKEGYAKLSDGAIIVDLNEYSLGIFLILKSDGNALYSTKDLALAELQDKEFSPNLMLHVVGSEQSLYFKQLIKTIELYNRKLGEKEKHLSYELVILPSGKMSSREGKVILFDDTLDEMNAHAQKEIKVRAKLNEKELKKRAKIIALSAIKFSMLSQDPKKVIVFDQEKSISFEGDTGPYLLYSYARANSILNKVKEKNKLNIKEINDNEFLVVKKLSQFNEVLLKSSEQFNPALVANYSFELCQLFNEFYHSSKVIGSGREDFLIYLVKSFKEVLGKSLNLLGIESLKEM